MLASNVNLFNPYSQELIEIERRRKLAEALQAQSMQPIEQQPTPAGGFATPISPMQGLAKIAQALAAAYGQSGAREQSKALGERYTKERADVVSQALKAGEAIPEQPEIPLPPDEIGGGPGRAAQPAIPANRTRVYEALAANQNFPDLQNIGITEMLKVRTPLKIDAGDKWEYRDPQNLALLGIIPKSATPDARLRAETSLQTHGTASGSAILQNQGAMQRHAAPSGSAQLGSETSIRGQDIGASTARRGQDITMRGQDIGRNTAIRGQDIGASTAIRGQDIGAQTSRRGQDLTYDSSALGRATTERGQDIGAQTARRGQDIWSDPYIQGQIAQTRGSGTAIGKATAEAALNLPQAIAAAKQSTDLIDQMIGDLQVNRQGKIVIATGGRKPHPGFSVGVGASVQPGFQYVPGTDKAGFYALKDQVLGGAFMEAYKTLKGGGQITEIEGKKATAAMTRMDTSQSEAEFVKAAREFQEIIRGAVARVGAQAAGVPQRRIGDMGEVSRPPKFLGFEPALRGMP